MTKTPRRPKAPARAELPEAPTNLPRATPAKDGSARGRPTDLTPAVWDYIMEMHAQGLPESVIGPSIPEHVHHRPLSRAIIGQWRAHGETDIAEGRASVFAQFADALRAARDFRLDSHMGYVAAAQSKDWRAALTLARMEWRKRQGLPMFEDTYEAPLPPPGTTAGSNPEPSQRVLTTAQREAMLARARALRDADLVQLKEKRRRA